LSFALNEKDFLDIEIMGCGVLAASERAFVKDFPVQDIYSVIPQFFAPWKQKSLIFCETVV